MQMTVDSSSSPWRYNKRVSTGVSIFDILQHALYSATLDPPSSISQFYH